MAAATTTVEATGSRRAVVKSEKFVEWQRELSSSRAIHGSRKRHDETDTEAVDMKKSFAKSGSEEYGARPEAEVDSDEREEGEEPVTDSVEDSKKKKPQRLRTDVKKFRKETEVDEKRAVHTQNKEKSPVGEGEVCRMRKCKQLTGQYVAASHPKRQLQAPAQKQTQAGVVQPMIRRRQRHVQQSTTPKEKKDIERVLRSLTRNRGSETPPPPAAPPTGKGTKRSKRVAQRLANEDPPPPPLKMPKLHIVLTRKEIQDDWLKITGHKYIGKPKKSTIVQRGLGLCIPLTVPSSIRYLNEPQCQ